MRKVKAQPENTVDTILRAGQIVEGKYRVDRLLGQGGMAAVWAGTNERTGKRVALKVILPSLATTREAQQLLHSEALAASRVNHPNVVTIFDVIEHEGLTCIVMELLDGEPLGSYIARHGFLSVGEVTTLLLPAMRGVAAAHAQGVIHRDLKPQNIFICIGPDGRIVTTKVLDFGISVMAERLRDPSAGPVPALTLGTPAYMSPEHISGAGPIDQRADVYGFGVLLYEALTGQMAFPGEQGPALFERILNEPPPPVKQFRPDLPPGLVHIIEKAMAKDPNRRYAGLNSLVSAIEDEVAPVTPPPRLLTPVAGVPSAMLPNPASEPYPGPAVRAILDAEPSAEHKETKILFGFPLENEERAPNGEGKGGQIAADGEGGGSNGGSQIAADGEGGGSNDESPEASAANGEGIGGSSDGSQEETAPNCEASAESTDDSQEESAANWGADAGLAGDPREAATRPILGLQTARLFRRLGLPRALPVPAVLSALRGWRAPVAGGAAVLLGLVVWIAMQDDRQAQTTLPAPVVNPMPATREPAAPPPVPAMVPTATVPLVVLPAPLAAPPSTPAASPLAAPGQGGPTARAVPTAVSRRRSPVAAREISKNPPLRQQSRSTAKGDEPAATPPPAPSADPPAKAPPPRAGRLTRDDF